MKKRKLLVTLFAAAVIGGLALYAAANWQALKIEYSLRQIRNAKYYEDTGKPMEKLVAIGAPVIPRLERELFRKGQTSRMRCAALTVLEMIPDSDKHPLFVSRGEKLSRKLEQTGTVDYIKAPYKKFVNDFKSRYGITAIYAGEWDLWRWSSPSKSLCPWPYVTLKTKGVKLREVFSKAQRWPPGFRTPYGVVVVY